MSTAPSVERGEDLHVDAVREERRDRSSGRRSGRGRAARRRDRCAATHARCGLPTSMPIAGEHRDRRASRSTVPSIANHAHVDGDLADGSRRPRARSTGSGAGTAADDELAARLEPARRQVVREDPHAVAAHLGDRAVGVAVVHEPVVGADAVAGVRRALRRRPAHRPSRPAGPRPRRARACDRTAPRPAGRQVDERRRDRAAPRSRSAVPCPLLKSMRDHSNQRSAVRSICAPRCGSSARRGAVHRATRCGSSALPGDFVEARPRRRTGRRANSRRLRSGC